MVSNYNVVDLIKSSMKDLWLNGYEGEDWQKSNKIKNNIKKCGINTEGLIYTVEEIFTSPVYLYQDYMIFRGEKILYNDIVLTGNAYILEEVKHAKKYFFFSTKKKEYSYNISFETGEFIFKFVNELLKYVHKDVQYYLDIIKAFDKISDDGTFFLSTISTRWECARRVCELEPDNYEACRIKSFCELAKFSVRHNSPKTVTIFNVNSYCRKRYVTLINELENARQILEYGEKNGWFSAYSYHNDLLRLLHIYAEFCDIKVNRALVDEYVNHCNKMLAQLNDNTLTISELEKSIDINETYITDFLCASGIGFFENKQICNYKISAKMIDAALGIKDIQMTKDYGKIAYILSIYYRDGLGEKEKSEEERYKWLMESANRKYGESFFELYKIAKDNGNELEAAKWYEEVKKYEKANKVKIRRETRYRKTLNESFTDIVGLDIREPFDVVANAAGSISSAVDSVKGAVSGISDIGEKISLSRSDREKKKIQRELDRIHGEEEVEKAKINKDTAIKEAETENMKAIRRHDNWEKRVRK